MCGVSQQASSVNEVTRESQQKIPSLEVGTKPISVMKEMTSERQLILRDRALTRQDMQARQSDMDDRARAFLLRGGSELREPVQRTTTATASASMADAVLPREEDGGRGRKTRPTAIAWGGGSIHSQPEASSIPNIR